MIGESLLLLKGYSISHVTCKVLCALQTNIHSSYNNNYKMEYKVTVMGIFFNIMITVHKYQESNVDITWLCYFTCYIVSYVHTSDSN